MRIYKVGESGLNPTGQNAEAREPGGPDSYARSSKTLLSIIQVDYLQRQIRSA